MSSFRRVVLLISAAALWIGPARAGELEAGAARVDITPPIGLPMWGYGARHDRPSEGTLDPLHAEALVLAAGGERLAIVGLDLGRAPTRRSMAAIRERVRREAGVGAVLLVASHTHHGPVIELDDQPTPEQPWVRTLEDRLVEVIVTAAANRRPARVGVARVEVDLNANRHSRLPEKPIDRELAVIRVDDREGRVLAVAVNFAAHPTMLPAGTMRHSADFPGVLKRTIERELGGTALFLQGAAGDLRPRSDQHPGYEAFGEALAREAVAVARGIQTRSPPEPSIKVREEEFHFPDMRVDLRNPLVRLTFEQAYFPALVQFYVDEYRDGVRPHLTVAVLNDELGLVGASGEFFSAHAVRLKQRSRLPHTLFFGYCNDYHQYFPTIEAAAERGYGADPATSPVTIGAGEQIMDRALFHLYDMQGRFNRRPF